MDYRELFSQVHRRSGMFGLDGSFKMATAFVTGCDAGNAWCLLNGFREWLVVKLGHGNNLAWPGVVLQICFPNEPSAWAPYSLDEQHDPAATEALFALLDEFLEVRGQHDGLRRIFEEHGRWLEQQEVSGWR
jgi:hypothetical protein